PGADAGATYIPGLQCHAFPAVIKPCRSIGLNAIVSGSVGLTFGQVVSSVTIGNNADTACLLRGVPRIELLGADDNTSVDQFPLCESSLYPCAPLGDVILSPH